MPQFDEAELAGLGPEELAALEDDDEATSEDEPEAEAADEPEAEPVAAQADEPEPVAEPEPEPAAQDEFQPRYQADPVEDYQDKLAAFSEQKKALRQQYQDGELDLDDYEDKRDAIEGEVLALREANLKASMAAEQMQQAQQQRWLWEQDRFFRHEANAAYKTDPILAAALDVAIKNLAADSANEQKPMSWFLEEADRQTRARFAVSPQQQMAGKRPVAQRNPPPPNLGDIPAAEIPATGAQSEWSHLDKLSGMDLERALAKMSEAEQERYLTGS